MGSKIKVCKICKVFLIRGENWFYSNLLCRKHLSEYQNEHQRVLYSKYRLNPEYMFKKRESRERYSKTDKGRKAHNRAISKHEKKYPKRAAARSKLKYWVKTGKLTRGACKICGTDKSIEAHHTDYSKSLEVEWYCSLHHKVIENRILL